MTELKFAHNPWTQVGAHSALLVDVDGNTVAEVRTPNPNAIEVAEQLAKTQRCLRDAILVIEDFMPNIGRCVLQDYERLNDVLCDSRELLK